MRLILDVTAFLRQHIKPALNYMSILFSTGTYSTS